MESLREEALPNRPKYVGAPSVTYGMQFLPRQREITLRILCQGSSRISRSVSLHLGPKKLPFATSFSSSMREGEPPYQTASMACAGEGTRPYPPPLINSSTHQGSRHASHTSHFHHAIKRRVQPVSVLMIYAAHKIPFPHKIPLVNTGTSIAACRSTPCPTGAPPLPCHGSTRAAFLCTLRLPSQREPLHAPSAAPRRGPSPATVPHAPPLPWRCHSPLVDGVAQQVGLPTGHAQTGKCQWLARSHREHIDPAGSTCTTGKYRSVVNGEQNLR